MRSSAARVSLLVLLVATSAGCGGSDDTPPSPSGAAGGGGGGQSCMAGTPEFTFGPTGLSDTNEMLGVKVFLADANQRPPYNGPNDWVIQFTDMMGNNMPTANLTHACAWMPAHGHGSNPKMVENLGDGKYKLIRQNLAMQGNWEIKLWVDPTGGGTTYTGNTAPALNRIACSGPNGPESLTLRTCVPN